MISQTSFRHGAALCAIADCPQFTAVNKASGKYGHYALNHDRELYLKYCSEPGKGCSYGFVINDSDVEAMRGSRDQERTFLVFICGDEVMTALSLTELSTIADWSAGGQQWLHVVARPNQSLRVRGPLRELGPIGRGDFPARLLQ